MKKALLAILIAFLSTYAVAQHEVDMSVTYNVSGATFNVYRTTGVCPSTPLPTTSMTKVYIATTTSQADPNVVAGVLYCYYWTAVVSGVESGPSNQINPQVPVAAPTGMTAAVSGNNVNLSWTPTVDSVGSVAYNVYRISAACPAAAPPISSMTKLTTTALQNIVAYTDTTASTVGSYCYYSTATVNGIESPVSNGANASVTPGAPSSLLFTVK